MIFLATDFSIARYDASGPAPVYFLPTRSRNAAKCISFVSSPAYDSVRLKKRSAFSRAILVSVDGLPSTGISNGSCPSSVSALAMAWRSVSGGFFFRPRRGGADASAFSPGYDSVPSQLLKTIAILIQRRTESDDATIFLQSGTSWIVLPCRRFSPTYAKRG